MHTKPRTGASRKIAAPTPKETSEAESLDYPRLSAEFLRALRGKRSQTVFARRLGYRSNVSHNWENRRTAPSAARTFWIMKRLGVDVGKELSRFFRMPPPWLEHTELTTADGVATLLEELKGGQSIVSLAAALGKSRFTLTRWMNASTEPRLPEFFEFVERTTLRLLDFVSLVVDPEQLPSVRMRWRAMQQARTLAYAEPWSQAVLRALETERYRAAPHSARTLASVLGVAVAEVERCLVLLEQSRQVRWDGDHFRLETVQALDIGRDRDAARALRAWWAEVGVERARAGASGMVYNLFGVSRVDLERLRQLQKRYVAELRDIVSESVPVECVVLSADLLMDLSESDES
jgi:DNA-binding transcriptional regulator YiaG